MGSRTHLDPLEAGSRMKHNNNSNNISILLLNVYYCNIRILLLLLYYRCMKHQGYRGVLRYILGLCIMEKMETTIGLYRGYMVFRV